MRFSATLVALILGYTALVSAAPNYVEYVTVTRGDTEPVESSPVYSVDTSTYQVSAEMPDSDLYEMLCLVNKCRQAHGKTPLALHHNLVKSAQVHSQYMAQVNKMTHDDYRGGLGDRITSTGFPSWSGVSENIASGQDSVEQVVNAWIESPGHLSNILGNTVYCGFGRVGNMWTQEFASPSSKSLYPQSPQVCPNPGSKPVYSTSEEPEYTQDTTHETVEETNNYNTVQVDDYIQEQENHIKYVTQYVQPIKQAPVQTYQTQPRVKYVTQYVQGSNQQPAKVYQTIEPAKVYYTAEPIVDDKAGCDE